MIVIFDLDDTLVNYKMTVPRQTFHMLNRFKKEGYLIGVITYNPLANYVISRTGLKNYVDCVVYKDADRDVLFKRCLDTLQVNEMNELNGPVHYIDDRMDNLNVVKKSFPQVQIHHCNNVYELYMIKKLILML